MHRRRWRKQRSRSRARNVSNAPFAAVGAVGLMRAVEDHCIRWIQSIEQYTNRVQKERKREREETARSSQWKEDRAFARAHIERTRMEFTSTNSISVWERTRSSARSSMHAPRGKYILENAGHRSSSSHRAPRCCRGKNRAALKGDIFAIWRDVGSLFFSLSRYSTRSSVVRDLPEISP